MPLWLRGSVFHVSMTRAALVLALSGCVHGLVQQPCAKLRVASRVSPITRHLSPGEAWASYSAALETAPLLTKCVTATCIIGAGDAVAQAIENRKTGAGKVDATRTLRWGVFGLVLQAPWNHYYQNAIEAAIPSTPNPWTVITGIKVVLDQFVQAPIFTILVFYFFAIIEGRGLKAAAQQVRATLKDTLLKNWLIFIPATVSSNVVREFASDTEPKSQAINFAFIPLEYRVLWINCVFFCWVIILSLLINETKVVGSSE